MNIQQKRIIFVSMEKELLYYKQKCLNNEMPLSNAMLAISEVALGKHTMVKIFEAKNK